MHVYVLIALSFSVPFTLLFAWRIEATPTECIITNIHASLLVHPLYIFFLFLSQGVYIICAHHRMINCSIFFLINSILYSNNFLHLIYIIHIIHHSYTKSRVFNFILEVSTRAAKISECKEFRKIQNKIIWNLNIF